MKKVLLSLIVAVLLLASFASFVVAAPGSTNPAVAKKLAAVRQATVKYHDVAEALDDGYVPVGPPPPVGPCVPGMGIHYVNFGLAFDPALDLTMPEILLYVPTDGGVRLVAVEYFFAIGAPDDPIPDPAPPAPILFGRPMNGPMAPHGPGEPPHYDLHVWLWQGNPDGIFENFNPNVSCP